MLFLSQFLRGKLSLEKRCNNYCNIFKYIIAENISFLSLFVLTSLRTQKFLCEIQ